MAVTEYDDSSHYGFFMTGTTLTSQTGKYARLSELVLSALRAQGVLDDMEDGTTAPVDTSKLWLDKNTDPAVLKEYDSVGSAWVAMTRDRMFGRAIATELTNVGGTANAITVDQPDPFIDGRMYFITPTADNTGATTIQVTGVGTYNVVTPSGVPVGAGAMITGNATVMLFTGGVFKILFSPTIDAVLSDGSVTNSKIADGTITVDKVISTFFDDGEVTLDDANAVARSLQDRFTFRVSVDDFGAVAYTVAEIEVLDGDASLDTVAATNTLAFQRASDFVSSLGGGVVTLNRGIYVKNEVTKVGRGVVFDGMGVGYWQPIIRTRPKSWEGTTVLMKGTVTRDHTLAGMTSQEHGGGWRDDPDSAAHFKLTSFHHADATGTTPATARQFSVAFKADDTVDGYSDHWGLRNMRVTNWSGTNGIEGHSDTGSSSLGDACDIGVLVENSEYVCLSNVQVVGDWREFALLITTPGFEDFGLSERNIIEHSMFQGRVGCGLRSGDKWHVTGTTSNSVEIYFSTESYWPSSGTFKGSDNVTYTYSGVTHTGTATSFTFTGVTPDPNAAGIFQVRNPKDGTGFANTEFHDCLFNGLDHISADPASTFSLSDSKPLEMSGYPMRGVKFRNCKFHTGEDIVFHLHDATDTLFQDCQFEGGGHVIASDIRTAQSGYANAAVADTRGLVISNDDGLSDMDARLFLPRNPDIDTIMREVDINGNLTIKAHRNGMQTIFESGAAGELARTSNDGFRIGQSTTDAPGAGNTTAGASIGTDGQGFFSVDGDYGLNVNRNTNDGVWVNFRRAGSTESSISVSSGVGSFNTFCGAHWSQPGEIVADLLPGTILETVDELCGWKVAKFKVAVPQEPILSPDGDIIEERPPLMVEQAVQYHGPALAGETVEVVYKGKTYSAIVEPESNAHLVKFKVSDTPSSTRVYGVFKAWDEDGDAEVAGLGAFFIRIASGEGVGGGELIESNGDGCGRVQTDDAIKSSTVAKITSPVVAETFDDGSYLVPCVLYCG